MILFDARVAGSAMVGARRRGQIALVVVVLSVVIPAVAGGTIVVNSEMFGVRLGNTMKQVRHTLGRPNEVNHRGGATTWFYNSQNLNVDFGRNHRVSDLSTTSPSQRTASGVGVGSSETAVMRFVPGVHCSPDARAGSGAECVAGSAHVVTDFHVTDRRGLVQSVVISQRP